MAKELPKELPQLPDLSVAQQKAIARGTAPSGEYHRWVVGGIVVEIRAADPITFDQWRQVGEFFIAACKATDPRSSGQVHEGVPDTRKA